MHEASIAESIIDAVEAFAKDKGYTRIEGVKVRVGKMTAVLPDALLFAFDALKEKTMLEGASLTIQEIPVRLKCLSCGHFFTPDSIRLACPLCNSVKTEVLSGKELDIESIDVE